MHLERSFGIPSKSPLEKYDALNDKFASFYFNGYGVKKHLKKLRKVRQSGCRWSNSSLTRRDTGSTQKCSTRNLPSSNLKNRMPNAESSLMNSPSSQPRFINYGKCRISLKTVGQENKITPCSPMLSRERQLCSTTCRKYRNLTRTLVEIHSCLFSHRWRRRKT
jgi:hypothetical protein